MLGCFCIWLLSTEGVWYFAFPKYFILQTAIYVILPFFLRDNGPQIAYVRDFKAKVQYFRFWCQVSIGTIFLHSLCFVYVAYITQSVIVKIIHRKTGKMKASESPISRQKKKIYQLGNLLLLLSRIINLKWFE